MNKDLKFAIGIPTINRYDLLKESLLKYLEQDFPNTEIFIIDNGNQNIDITHPNLFIHKSARNLGVASSWNLLCETIFEEYEYAFIINDDIYLGAKENEVNDLLTLTPKQDFYVTTVNWCAYIMPKTTYEKIGGFDTKFFPAYFEDNDMHQRMKLHNMSYYVSQILTPQVFRNSMTIDKDSSLNENFDKNKEYYVKKWGGLPGEEKYKEPFDGETGRVLNIITPTIRTENLKTIYESITACKEYDFIKVYWWIVLDRSIYKEYKWIQNEFESISTDKLRISVVLSDKEKAIAGHAHRNIILNLLSDFKLKDEWVYFLDDDNILHENFYNFFSNRKLVSAYKGIIFSQVNKDGNIRLIPREDNIKVCHVDTAMFLFKVEILEDLRFVETDYCADGLFIEELYKRHSKSFCVLPDVLSYYNYIPSKNLTMNSDKNDTDNQMKSVLSFCPVPILQNEWEFDRLLSLYLELQPKNIMEIGSFYGGTLWYWLMSTNPSTLNKVVTLDYPVPPSDGRYEEMIESRNKWKEWIEDAQVQEFHNVIGDSTSQESKQKVDSILKEGELDFLFIDGGHTYDVVKSDYETYGKYVRKGGIIAFHDVIGLEEVKQYWNEIKIGKQYIEISHNTHIGWGIGVLFVD